MDLTRLERYTRPEYLVSYLFIAGFFGVVYVLPVVAIVHEVLYPSPSQPPKPPITPITRQAAVRYAAIGWFCQQRGETLTECMSDRGVKGGDADTEGDFLENGWWCAE